MDKIESAYGESDLAVVAVGVDEVRRASAVGLVVGDAFDEPARVHPVPAGRGEARAGKIGLVDGEDDAADAGDGFKVFTGGRGP